MSDPYRENNAADLPPLRKITPGDKYECCPKCRGPLRKSEARLCKGRRGFFQEKCDETREHFHMACYGDYNQYSEKYLGGCGYTCVRSPLDAET